MWKQTYNNSRRNINGFGEKKKKKQPVKNFGQKILQKTKM